MDQFSALLPPNNPKNQNFEKRREKPADVIILHKCTQNYDHMLHCFWDRALDGCNFYFSFWAIFFPFATTQKIKILKKWKKHLDIIILQMCTKNYDHMMYSSWDMVHNRWPFSITRKNKCLGFLFNSQYLKSFKCNRPKNI